jgi:cytosine/adenosine deaminase-related metal-dependent hydrolase
MPLSLQARIVFPVDAPPIEFGVVTIEGDLIVEVGTETHGKSLIDLGNVALLPGLVNAHTHLEFSHFDQPLGQPGMSLVDWIRLVIAERAGRKESSTNSLARGIEESHRHGATTIGDISTSAKLPRGDIVHFHEVIGFSRARADSVAQALSARLGDATVSLTGQGISPHAPYTVSPALLQKLVSIAQRNFLPMAMHLAESPEELQLLRDGNGPFQSLLDERSMWDAGAISKATRPLDYLRMLEGARTSLIVHGNYLDQEELEFIAAHRRRMSLVYCPRTHAYFFHSPYPLGQAIAAGARVALGTDSRASNPDLSLLEEMRQVARTHPHIDPQEILRLGSLNGAEALGRAQHVGSIARRRLANLVAIPITSKLLATPDEILAEILASDSAPSVVYLAGRRLDS